MYNYNRSLLFETQPSCVSAVWLYFIHDVPGRPKALSFYLLF